MRTASIIINIIIFICTLIVILSYFRKDGKWQMESGRIMFRFFTVLSNTFCAVTALMMAVSQISGTVSPFVLEMKYLGTVSVTVTFVTVFLFLIPFQGGVKKWLTGGNIYMHLIGPLLAIFSFIFLEKQKMTFGTAMTGLLPMLLYGAVYLYKVMFAPEGKRWEDVYGFNREGKWPIACVAMTILATLICIFFWLV
ncbi:MAG: hypothetical protein IJ719_07640 [Clostridia bacterium]|nr:hypothetical protein [Clostridia bacterium]